MSFRNAHLSLNLYGHPLRKRFIIEAIFEKFSDKQADLHRERKAMTRLWEKRKKLIEGVIESTVGMYGELKGIVGQAIQKIEGLELPFFGSRRRRHKVITFVAVQHFKEQV